MSKRKRSIPERPDPTRYQPLLSLEDYQRLEDELRRPLPQAIRVNPLKINPAEAQRTWPEWYGWDIRPIPFCSAGWFIDQANTRPSQTIEHKLGFYYIQDAASMLPAELMDFDELAEPLVLDMASAPGGKSTHIAARTGDRGMLVANDSSHNRLPALRTSLLDWGAMSAVVTQFPGERIGSWLPDTFDRVLLDAPCSMENLRPTSSHSRPVSRRERQGLANRQVALLASALQATKPGGQVVYATCTLAPEENEAVIDSILKLFPDAVQVDHVSARVGKPAPGLTSLMDERYSLHVQNAIRLWPHIHQTSGFFAARLTKLGGLPVKQPGGEVPYRPFSKLGFSEVSSGGVRTFFNRLMDLYELDLETIFTHQRLALWRKENSFFALPQAFLANFTDLPVEWVGFPLGDDTRDGLIPSHELIARYGMNMDRCVHVLAEDERTLWLRGSDLPRPGDASLNDILVVKDEQGRLLGRAKVLNDKLKNMLPRRIAG